MIFIQTGQEIEFFDYLINLCPAAGIIFLLLAGIGIVIALARRRD